ncbi:hypothetical protein R1sor_005363 [Riccia sorocarpa]|uniref:3'-5' exonuclease domain-containing protein n=1 Tax=Riccia sorocarpa TaxID=122646 RepID=A0ABD3HJK0_9MARC
MATATVPEGAENPQFYKVPLPPQCVHFVDSAESEAFSLLLWALRNASVIAMDAEWKPVFNPSPSSGNPRVAIFQLACRLQDDAGIHKSSVVKEGRSHNSRRKRNEGYRELKPRGTTTVDTEGLSSQDEDETEPEAALEKYRNLASSQTESLGSDFQRKPEAHRMDGGGASEESVIGEGKSSKELIFILDLLAVPADAFAEVLKDALVDSAVLKLGFGFKQDLMNLRTTFPGPDSHCCFDKVHPYLDVGKLYKHLHKSTSSFVYRGKRISVGGDGLASIVEAVLGVPLSKDMQCSNWEQRPLSREQYDYAAADAYCLLALFDSLLAKTSDSWFHPVQEGLQHSSNSSVSWIMIEDDEDQEEDEASVSDSSSKVGIAELLSLQTSLTSTLGSNSGDSASIYQSKRGNAVNMVTAAIGVSNVRSGKEQDSSDGLEQLPRENETLGIAKLISRFGERLVISGSDCSSKRVRRKARSRRARVAKSKDQQDEDDVQWVGPPPWDSSVGGDEVPKFLCDAMVEGLARQLRCVGIDAASLNSRKCEPRELVELAEKEGRILLTRDIKLLRRKLVPTSLAYRVKRQGKWDQLAEIIQIFKLAISEDQLLTRCTKCNGDFVPKALNGEEAVAQAPWSQVIPECALKNVDQFWQCSVCKHVYWQGYQFTRAWKQFAAVSFCVGSLSRLADKKVFEKGTGIVGFASGDRKFWELKSHVAQRIGGI